jgi:thiamine-monophosphate kinase
VDEQVAAAARELGVDAFDWLASGGDDHAFAGTVSGEPPAGAIVIGTVVAATDPVVVFTDRGTPARGGHEHFSS